MSTPNLAMLLSTLMLLTTGCIGDLDNADDDAALHEGADEDLDAAQVAETPEPADPATWTEVGGAPITVPVAWDGAIATQVAVCEWENVGECVAVPPEEGDEAMYDPQLPGHFMAASLTLAWGSSSPAMDELAFVLMAMVETEDGMEHALWEYVQGPSPLVLDVASSDVPPDAMIMLHVGVPSHTPEPVYTFVSTDQAFHVEGTFTAMPMGDAPMAMHDH